MWVDIRKKGNMKTKFVWMAIVTLCLADARAVLACPFCTAVAQTLRQEMKQMDVVAIAIRTHADSESVSTFEIQKLIKGDQLVKLGQKIQINYFGRAEAGESFLIMGIDPPELLWSSPLQLSDKAIEYVDQVTKLSEDDGVGRLKFFIQHLADTDPILARDVYDEFASASYADMLQLKESYDRTWLLESVQDVDLPPDRRRLYLVMLGICGQPQDADELEKMLRSDDPNQRSGLDALISCYVSLKGAEALKLVNELYLINRDSTYADTYSAIMALRFHGTDGGVVERQAVADSLRIMLERSELADLVIPDLARWEDWTVINKVAELFKKADDKSSWVRVPVINYLRACPLPEAAKVLEELKEIDPVAFRRATQFFPVPQPAGPESSSSLPWRLHDRERYSDLSFAQPAGVAIASAVGLIPTNGGHDQRFSSHVNPLSLASVITTTCLTFGLAMWLAISGAGQPSVFYLVASKILSFRAGR